MRDAAPACVGTWVRAGLLGLVLLGAAAGAAGGPGPNGVVPEGTWWAVRWATPDGVRTQVPSARYALTVSGTDVFGTAACNRFAGRVADPAGVRVFGPLATTKAYCGDDGRGEAYVRALGAATSVDVAGDRLHLRGPEGDVTLVPAEGPADGGRQPSSSAARNRSP
ncbi:MAG: META domain-containing protein [Trueperaceae bacterium]|nr:META domain-containing protein [Trueperaceae bacterium]